VPRLEARFEARFDARLEARFEARFDARFEARFDARLEARALERDSLLEVEDASGVLATIAFLVVFRVLIKDFFWMVTLVSVGFLKFERSSLMQEPCQTSLKSMNLSIYMTVRGLRAECLTAPGRSTSREIDHG
jgi:hypothetical protein